MLPSELSYLAQERCKELRGETYKPIVFFSNDPRPALARWFHKLANRLESKPTQQFSQKTTES